MAARARRLLLIACLLGAGGCTNLFLQPMRQIVATPDEFGLEYEALRIPVSDDTSLAAWWLPAREPRASILFLHGNAENMSTHFSNVAWLTRHGFNVLAFDYEGYGDSGGKADLRAAHRDASAALDWIVTAPRAAGLPLVVYGQSLGGAIAVTTVAGSPHRDRVSAMIVESAFDSYRVIAREKLGGFWLTWPLQYPLSWTVDDSLSPVRYVRQLTMPKLFVAGTEDAVVPFARAQALYAAAVPPATLFTAHGGGHTAAFASPANRQKLLDWLERVPGPLPQSEDDTPERR